MVGLPPSGTLLFKDEYSNRLFTKPARGIYLVMSTSIGNTLKNRFLTIILACLVKTHLEAF